MIKTKDSVFNPAFYLGIGLFPVVMICTTAVSAMVFAGLIFLTWFFSLLLITAFRDTIMFRVRFVCYALTIVAVFYFLESAIFELVPKSYDEYGLIFLAILGSSVVFFELERTKEYEKFKPAFISSFFVILSYVISCIVVGILREILGSGSIFGKTIGTFSGLEFFNSVAGGLLIIVLVAFIHNIIAGIVLKRKTIFKHLLNRYSSVIESGVGEEVEK